LSSSTGSCKKKHNSDEIKLSWHLAKTLGLDIKERTFRHGLRQLLERGSLYESLLERCGLLVANTDNGDAFVGAAIVNIHTI
jgi:hypothetical protein